MTLDELFAAQSKSALVVTLEPIDGDDSHVKLTPWVQGVGCLCHLAVNVSKDSIETVEPTGDVHNCCGKQLRVVTVAFKKGATLDLETVIADLVSKASRRAAGRVDPLISSLPSYLEPLPTTHHQGQGGRVLQFLGNGSVGIRSGQEISQMPGAGIGRGPLRYFGAVGPAIVRDMCDPEFTCIYYSGCPWGCACMRGDGMGYCSTCCVA